jgi:hypothetical protein
LSAVLLLSNGHGEDLSAAAIGRQLWERGITVEALPLVGQGQAYRQAGITVLGPTRDFSTGGLGYTSLAARLTDLREGQLTYVLRLLGRLRRRRRRYRLVVAVGDLVPVLGAWLIWANDPFAAVSLTAPSFAASGFYAFCATTFLVLLLLYWMVRACSRENVAMHSPPTAPHVALPTSHGAPCFLHPPASPPPHQPSLFLLLARSFSTSRATRRARARRRRCSRWARRWRARPSWSTRSAGWQPLRRCCRS